MKYVRPKIALTGIILAGFLYVQNNNLMVSSYTYREAVPKELDGYVIVQVSDLQNKTFGQNHDRILQEIKESHPDIIVITGDLLDRNKTKDLEAAISFIRQAKNIAPIYFVSGNHEHQSGFWDELSDLLVNEGVTVLDNGKTIIEKDGLRLHILGLADYSVNPYYEEVLRTLMSDVEEGDFSILLSHRPELFDGYARQGVDLVFSGHAHGGQIRLPFTQGLFAPNQGFFPQYTSGVHEKAGTTMVVSRGLGNSVFPFRLFNYPELVTMRFISYEEI